MWLAKSQSMLWLVRLPVLACVKLESFLGAHRTEESFPQVTL